MNIPSIFLNCLQSNPVLNNPEEDITKLLKFIKI